MDKRTMSSFSVTPSIFLLLCYWWLLFSCIVHSSELPWIRLTHDNFSSDIHTHPFLLCLATVPWCGESRSLMRELSYSLSIDESLHSFIQLRIVYLNLDKSLKRFFSDRVRYPTFTFFWHSTPLKYKGKLRLQNILTAIYRGIGLNSWDLPLKKIDTAPNLESFMESTEKALIFFDFCNYTNKIQKSKHHQVVDKPIILSPGSTGNNNGAQAKDDRLVEVSKKSFASQMLEDLPQQVSNVGEYQTNFPLEQIDVQEHAEVTAKLITKDGDASHGMLVNDITKDNNEFSSGGVLQNSVGSEIDVQDQEITCESQTEFAYYNAPSDLFTKKTSEKDRHEKHWFTDSTKSGVLTQVEGCNRTEYKHFAKVYQSLIKIARVYTLTPELANFAVIENKSLLSRWGLERMQNHTWFLMQWMSDWPDLPRLYYESETLESFLSGPKQLVNELNRENINIPSSLWNNTMPVILFIDKVSSLPEVRKKSWEAITALRAFAREHTRQENLEMQVSTSMDFQVESKPSSESIIVQSVIEKEMPNDRVISLNSLLGQNVVLQSINQPIRVSKNPSSKDLNLLSQETAFDGNLILKVLIEGKEKLKVDPSMSNEDLQKLEFSKLLLSEENTIYRIQGGKIVGEVDTDSILSTVEGLGSLLSSNVGGSFMGLKSAKLSDRGKYPVEVIEEEVITELNQGRTFSFFFADGEDQWKDMVQPGLPYPSLVILDSLQGGKFMFSTLNQSIDYASLKDFFDQFATKKLQKTYLSEVTQRKPRKQVQPPFVNRDFHEVDGVPRVTAQRLLQILAQHSKVSVSCLDLSKDVPQCWERAVLVLFTQPSCGFCKRMELVFREVHQLLTNHLNRSVRECFLGHFYSTFDNDYRNAEMIGGNLLGTNGLESEGKLPGLFQIDCILNDCGGFFQSIDQEELYPSVIFYPARNKTQPVVFRGQSTVQEILKFIAVEGEAGARILSFLRDGTQKKRSGTQKKRSDKTANLQTGECHSLQLSESILIDSRSSSSRHAFHFTADATQRPSGLSQSDDDKEHTVIKPIVYPTVGSVLLATDQLSKASKAFESSKILIVKADGQEGFQGLIFNKPLAWNRLPGLDTEMEPLVNRTVLCYGGPVILQEEPFSSLSRLRDMDRFAEVIPGVYVGGPSATMRVFQFIKEGRLKAADFWFFLGHAVWGWEQLLNEIEQQWWNLTSYEVGTTQLPIQEWLEGSTISVVDLLRRKL